LRLTQIKLSGFKSFVETMVIPVPGQLVGVVGPNGCGKSNVIDAVRWVLGESQAKQLRGETMLDVIFNGSANRKPLSRASVELLFDNSLARAVGQWSQYAEISVKRVLTRQSESSYYINGTHVRRRDVQDIFLGTGLGPRAYAIIEQGMISRIIEAKPEELRVFLEEAAGVSKYKERRKETESRLADTRDNLARVADILAELTLQLEKLEGQAAVAEQYHRLHGELSTTENLLTFSKKRDADNARDRYAREIDKLGIQLEAQAATLRECESGIESARQEHYSAGDALHAAQGELYAANSEVARLEQELQYLRDNRRRIESQLASVAQQLAEASASRDNSGAELQKWQDQLLQAGELVTARRNDVEAARASLPEAEQRVREGQARVAEAQRAVAQAEQAQSLEEARESNALKILSQLEARKARLNQEKMSLAAPAEGEIERTAAELGEAQLRLVASEESLRLRETELPQQEARRGEAMRAEQDAAGQVARLEAQLAALTSQQHRLDNNQKLASWLARHELSDNARLWQEVSVEPGWEDALESVLGARLNAIELPSLDAVQQYLAEPPPGTVSFFAPIDRSVEEPASSGLKPLLEFTQVRNAHAASFLRGALAHVYVLEDAANGLARSRELPTGTLLVTRHGHVYSHAGVLFYGPQSELHGVLQRQREIDELKTRLPDAQGRLNELKRQVAQAAEAVEQGQAEARRLRGEVAQQRDRAHALQLTHLKLSERAQQVAGRSAQIREELAAIREQEEHENRELGQAQHNLEEGGNRIQELVDEEDRWRAELTTQEAELDSRRNTISAAERAAQEAVFFDQTCRDKIHSVTELGRNVEARIAELTATQATLGEELSQIAESPSSGSLQTALQVREQKEKALGSAREHLEELTTRLREAEEAKLGFEQALNPIRDKITEVRFKEQEARINGEQFDSQLREANADLAQLGELIEKRRTGALQSDIVRLSEEIAALGPVNLAALAELQSGRERKEYLDAQAIDLREAVETLEGAIKRIDRETRQLLQSTYDAVNRNFSELFPTLFGGGQASLILTGEEILDAGMTVMAQPPGKKNSSIHLLSGGEKALTALALVFALFRLNPAPFCLLDEVDAPLDDANTERFCELVKKMTEHTQFLYISHNKITMEMAHQLVGITMQEQGVSRVVAVDIDEALRLKETEVAV
jgi:chromosome segregation protein